MIMDGIKGLATGIGSLPHKDAARAVEEVFKYCPEIPFWPQLPKRDAREGMVAQFCEGLPCLKVTKDGVYYDASQRDKELEGFYQKITSEDASCANFAISKNDANGLYAFYDKLADTDLARIKYIKLHVTGPFTFRAGIKDEKGVSLLHDHEMRQAAAEGLIAKALWQVGFFEKFGKKTIVFIDEPYLSGFGSAYTPINREEVVDILSDMTARIKVNEGVFTGLHCCGNTDWSIFTEVETLDIINFDAFSFLDKLMLYSQDLKKFFIQGRALCWGIVPTNEFRPDLSEAQLVEKISSGMEALAKKGVDAQKLSQNLLLSPACGMGTLDEAVCVSILKLLARVSSRLR